MKLALEMKALLKLSNNCACAEGAAKIGPKHNAIYERSFMKAPENNNRERGKLRVLARQYGGMQNEEE